MDRAIGVRAICYLIKQNQEEIPEVLASLIWDKIEEYRTIFGDAELPPVEPRETARKKPGRPPGARSKAINEKIPQPSFAVGENEQEEQLHKKNSKSLIVTPDSKEGREILNDPGGIVKAIRLGPNGVRRKEDPSRDRWTMEELSQTIHDNTPPSIEVEIPDKGVAVLKRNVIRNDAIKTVKLLYYMDGMKSPEAIQANGWSTRGMGIDSMVSPVNLDKTTERNFITASSRDIDFDRIMASVKGETAEKLSKSGEIINHAPIRTGYLTVQVDDKTSQKRGEMVVRNAVSASDVHLISGRSVIEVQKGAKHNPNDVPAGLPAAALKDN